MERRGLTGSIAAVRGKENRSDENPITEEWELIEALNKQAKCAYYSCASGDGLSDKLFLLRQKLSQKAKQEQCAFKFMRHEVPVLRTVRPDLSARCTGGGLETGACQ